MTMRSLMGLTTGLAVSVGLGGALVLAQGKGGSFSAALVGGEEVPSVSTGARGSISLSIDDDAQEIDYTLTFDGLQGTVQQAHIHFAQPSVNGGIVLWLCKTAAFTPSPVNNTPDCPASGSVSGTLTAADVRATATTQQVAVGEFAEVVDAIRSGLAYANVHTTISPGGEIRGQLRKGGGHK